MKKIVRFLLILAALLVSSYFILMHFFTENVADFLVKQQIKQTTTNYDYLDNKEAITVFTVGTASPIPSERVQTCTAVFVNGQFFVFDVGDGAVMQMEKMGLPLNKVAAAFITHWHSDHYIDLPYLINRSWVLGRDKQIDIYGPKGLDTIMHALQGFLRIENQHRVDHHGDLMDLSIATGQSNEFSVKEKEKKVVYNQNDILITAFDVDHDPIKPAVGYAIEYKGKKVVLSGDTKLNPMVQAVAQGADLLLHEIMLMSLIQKMQQEMEVIGNERNAHILHDIQEYHTSPAEVANLAQAAQVKKLVLHHFAPAPDLNIVKKLYEKELVAFDGAIHFANDGDCFIVD